MDWIKHALDFVLHFDRQLEDPAFQAFIQQHAVAVQVILFAIIFCETGLVVTPFLPGDSLLFAAGAVAFKFHLNVHVIVALLTMAAILGDTVNYWVGSYIGPRAFSGKVRFLKKEYLDRTHRFYEKHGGKTIILARFIPIIRTFAPFVAGIGAMNYARFLVYNVVGGVAWVVLLTYAGYFFAENEFVRKNFSLVIVAIIFLSVLPIAIEFVLAKYRARKGQSLD